jgi:hypothetical protein
VFDASLLRSADGAGDGGLRESGSTARHWCAQGRVMAEVASASVAGGATNDCCEIVMVPSGAMVTEPSKSCFVVARLILKSGAFAASLCA